MRDTAYRLARHRIANLALALSTDQLKTAVPATPGWTVHNLLAHLVGGAADVAVGRLDRAGSDQWTRRHVQERCTRSIDELLAEWDRVGLAVETTLTNPTFTGPNLAADTICHEADLHEALGLGRVDRQHWQPFLDTMMQLMHRRSPRSNALLIHDDHGRQWHCGVGEPAVVLRADGYELLRGAYSRRSRRQIAVTPMTGSHSGTPTLARYCRATQSSPRAVGRASRRTPSMSLPAPAPRRDCAPYLWNMCSRGTDCRLTGSGR